MAKGTPLTLHRKPTPPDGEMPELLRAQLGPLLDQALTDGPDGLDLIELFEIRRGNKHLYDLHLFAGDDGQVHHAGTLERVASFSEGGATGTSDQALRAALDEAHRAWRGTNADRAPERAPKAATKIGATRIGRPKITAPDTTPTSLSTTTSIPRLRVLHSKQELGKKLDDRVQSGVLHIAEVPKPPQLTRLREYLATRASTFVVELGASVPLSILEHLEGVPFVVLASGRKSFDGLEALPRSVRRLSIRKHARPLTLNVPKDHGLAQLDLEAPSVASSAPLPELVQVAWKGATDLTWLETQPGLRVLGLRNTTITSLPAIASLERLLLFSPTKLASLTGLDALPRLGFLRVDKPQGMKRLGSLARNPALKTLVLVGAHAIGDLSDLETPHALETLVVSMTQLEAKPFEALAGRLKAGSFQLKSNTHTRALQAHLALPHAKIDLLEPGLFDLA